MTKEEFEAISSALDDCKRKIESSFDNFIEEIKNLEITEN